MTRWMVRLLGLTALSLVAMRSPNGADAADQAVAPDWQNRDNAVVEALDKVNARSSNLTIRVGESAKFGVLTIQVQSCVVRPPDRAADSAAFLVVTDPRPGAPAFHGWMFASAPAASMMEHPIYDVRVMSCF